MWVGFQNKDTCLKKVRTPCLEHDDIHKFNSAHDWGDLYDHLMSTRIIHFDAILIKIVIMRKVAMAGLDLDLLTILC